MRSHVLKGLFLTVALAACQGSQDPGDNPDPDVPAPEVIDQGWTDGAPDPVPADDKSDAPGSDCSGVLMPDSASFGKRIALTFDDGPNPATTPTVLAALRSRRNRDGSPIPATFFIMGTMLNVDEARTLYDELLNDPIFIVGNHSYDHANFRELSSWQVDQELRWVNSDGVDASPPSTYFRFPYGFSSCDLNWTVKNEGYRIVGWHIDSHDWAFQPDGRGNWYTNYEEVPPNRRWDMPGHVYDQVRSGIGGSSNGGVVLFHDVRPITAQLIGGIIDRLLADGYTFVGLDDVSTFPNLNRGGTDPPADRCFSETLQAYVDVGECVQASWDKNWYQCGKGGEFLGPLSTNSSGPVGACTLKHPLR